MTKINYFSSLPNEVLCTIFSFLDPETLARCARVGRLFRNISVEPQFWQAQQYPYGPSFENYVMHKQQLHSPLQLLETALRKRSSEAISTMHIHLDSGSVKINYGPGINWYELANISIDRRVDLDLRIEGSAALLLSRNPPSISIGVSAYPKTLARLVVKNKNPFSKWMFPIRALVESEDYNLKPTTLAQKRFIDDLCNRIDKCGHDQPLSFAEKKKLAVSLFTLLSTLISLEQDLRIIAISTIFVPLNVAITLNIALRINELAKKSEMIPKHWQPICFVISAIFARTISELI